MATRRLRTADYSAEARARLGEAVTNQREADGYKFRPAFARVAGVSLRSLAAVEQGEAGVGATNLRAIGRALSTWDESTAQVVLDGGPIPATAVATTPAVEHDEMEPQDEYEQMIVDSSLSKREKRKLLRGYRDALQEERRMLRGVDHRHPNSPTVDNDMNSEH
ncbi:hypothetical protein [Sciscionella sediminilitoris]|uniref:hypothetical protein n=1 Tax=Sciscionella sediminilitoris TaxID=1445613 RepID=UPI0012E24B9C|nr:hypothetical protein [Sciscionella sp. SE31]